MSALRRTLNELKRRVLPSRPAPGTGDLHDHFAYVSDRRWRELLFASIDQELVEGARFPKFPSEETQVLFTSFKREQALDEALAFLDITKQACRRFGKPLAEDTQLLDFGAGWGRISRTFMRDVASRNIFGVDVNPPILKECQRIMPYGTYSLCSITGPLAFTSGSFDLVVAFSVFSHLSPKANALWLDEMSRVLKPGGLAVFTTLAPSFVALCRNCVEKPDGTPFQAEIGRFVEQAYPNWKSELTLEQPPDFLYLPSGGGTEGMEPSEYGWAMVSERYGRKKWADRFEICRYDGTAQRLPQAYFVLRRR